VWCVHATACVPPAPAYPVCRTSNTHDHTRHPLRAGEKRRRCVPPRSPWPSLLDCRACDVRWTSRDARRMLWRKQVLISWTWGYQLDNVEHLYYRGGMSDKSAIEWTDATWNPVTGCTQVSPGCDHCYALTFAERFRGVPGHHYEQGFDLRLWPERLRLPLKWRQPRRIFAVSMGDPFHKDVPDDFIRRMWDVMVEAHWHSFQVLTKRPQRMARLAASLPWPSNIWAGTSIETNQYAWRANHLRRVPAAVRFISAEPLLGSLEKVDLTDIDWVITGGESGHKHRPCDAEWVSDLQARCQLEGISFFHKQWGGRTPKAGGRELHGRTWDEYPTPRIRATALL